MDDKDKIIHHAYRIVEVTKDGSYKTLFHGVQGSRCLPIDKWITADQRIVSDGGTEYMSGFHVLSNYHDCLLYLKRFTSKKRTLRIISVHVKNFRRKKHSNSEVYLAKEMCIPVNNEIAGDYA